jgi:hypothetical protein
MTPKGHRKNADGGFHRKDFLNLIRYNRTSVSIHLPTISRYHESLVGICANNG